MKRYNYKTKKIYESVSVFSLSLDEFDANGELIDSKDFEDTYSTLEDAIEDAYDIMTNVAENDNIDEDDVAYDENGNTITFTVDGVGTWVFTVESSQNEYGHSVSDSDENEYYDDYSSEVNDSDSEDNANESVAERFARLRKMFESDDDSDDESDDDSDGDSDDDSDDETENDNEGSDETSDENSEEDEDEEMKAVIITVKKGDEDKCKDELIDAGISEDDIEILEADEDDDNIDIRIDVNAVMELKDYLSKKGIDLEEEIGGEIVSDEDSEDSDEENDDENKEDDNEEEFDFDNLGDIFGAEDEE